MTTRPTLDELGKKYGTDKSSTFHDYLRIYEQHCVGFRDQVRKVLEIGVLDGASLRMWEEYFDHAEIFGVDIVPSAERHAKGRVKVVLADQSNIEDLVSLATKFGPFDLIVEDGSHMWEHQITSLRTLFPFLTSSGLYIIEDLHTNYGDLSDKYRGVALEPIMSLMKKWIDLKVGDDQIDIALIEDPFLRTYGRSIDSISFLKRACIIRKNFRPLTRRILTGTPLFEASESSENYISLTAHVGNVGDVFGFQGFVNLGGILNNIQGISIDSGGLAEYRVRTSDLTWTEWVSNGVFLGTRGEASGLTGIQVRLTHPHSQNFLLRTAARFNLTDEIKSALNGEECISEDYAELCGIQLEIVSLNH